MNPITYNKTHLIIFKPKFESKITMKNSKKTPQIIIEGNK
jgi:hypothetical protein